MLVIQVDICEGDSLQQYAYSYSGGILQVKVDHQGSTIAWFESGEMTPCVVLG